MLASATQAESSRSDQATRAAPASVATVTPSASIAVAGPFAVGPTAMPPKSSGCSAKAATMAPVRRSKRSAFRPRRWQSSSISWEIPPSVAAATSSE
ncbi:MAG: hypothetical protein R3F20_19925 [Planctomycetota bacterium]